MVAAHGLDLADGDLQINDNGNIAGTPDGDLKFGNDRVNALHRLVQRWCFNAPTLAVLFKLVVHANNAKQNLDAELDGIFSIAFTNPPLAERFHDIKSEIGAHPSAGARGAGAIMVVLSNLLLRYRDDLRLAADKWEKGSPLIEGRSLGSIVTAAAANFRHRDEWARSHPPTNQQLASIKDLADVLKQPIPLDGSRHSFRRNVCPDCSKLSVGETSNFWVGVSLSS